MIEPAEVKKLIEAGLPGAVVEVTGDGSHFEATVITDAFAGKRTLERHQMINATMGDRFQTGVVHALSIT